MKNRASAVSPVFFRSCEKVVHGGGAIPDITVDLKTIPGIISPATGLTPTTSDRAQGTWEGADILVSNFTFDYDTYDYTLTVAGYTSEATSSGLKSGQTIFPYNEIGNVTTDGSTTPVSFTKPVPEKDSSCAPFGNIRINSDVVQNGGFYTLTSVILKGVEK